MTVVRVAVVGVGHLGQHHARIVSGMDGVTLVAVVDQDPQRAQDVAALYGGRAVATVADVIGEVDAVVVAVPTDAHVEVAWPCVERGIAVLVEKPLAPTLTDARALVELAERRGGVLAVGHTERFNPAVVAAAGVVRRPWLVDVRRLSPFPARSLDIDVVFDLMIHDLDLLLALVASPVTRVDAVGAAVLTPTTDIASARLWFESGCVATVTASRVNPASERTLTFHQADGRVSVDCAARTVRHWRAAPAARGAVDAAAVAASIAGEPVAVTDEEPLRAELLDFLDAVRRGGAPRVSGRAGLDAVALATRVTDEIARSRDALRDGDRNHA